MESMRNKFQRPARERGARVATRTAPKVLDSWQAVGLRQIRAVVKVAELGSIARAASVLRRSRSALSKSITKVEAALGSRVFDRARGSFVPTATGIPVVARFRTIEAVLGEAWREYDRAYRHVRPGSPTANFLGDVSTKRLLQLTALYDSGSVGAAAARLRVSCAAIHKTVREVESHFDVPLFTRLAAGRVAVSEFGSVLIPRLKLALSELGHAGEDLAGMRGLSDGRVAIGCLPSMASLIIPRAAVRALEQHPMLAVSMVEGSYGELVAALLSGDIDLIVGGVSPARGFPGVRTETLLNDSICIVGRAGHPLAGHARLTSADFTAFRWVLPARGNMTKPILEALLTRAGIRPAMPTVENASIVTLNGLLVGSDFLTVGTALQVRYEEQRGSLVQIPFRLSSESWPSGIIIREATEPSRGARLYIDALRQVCTEFHDCRRSGP